MIDRKVELITDTMETVPVAFENLQIGDKFRMFEPDGKPVSSLEGKTGFIARSLPMGDPMGIKVDVF